MQSIRHRSILTTSLWTTVFIRPHQFTTNEPDFLRSRISRTKGRLVDVCIWLVTEQTTIEVAAACKILAEYKDQIRRFEPGGRTAMDHGGGRCRLSLRIWIIAYIIGCSSLSNVSMYIISCMKRSLAYSEFANRRENEMLY